MKSLMYVMLVLVFTSIVGCSKPVSLIDSAKNITMQGKGTTVEKALACVSIGQWRTDQASNGTQYVVYDGYAEKNMVLKDLSPEGIDMNIYQIIPKDAAVYIRFIKTKDHIQPDFIKYNTKYLISNTTDKYNLMLGELSLAQKGVKVDTIYDVTSKDLRHIIDVFEVIYDGTQIEID